MTLRALRRPIWNTNNVLLAMSMSASVILLGCGGGGGGGGGNNTGPGVCGSAANSTQTVVCGRVVVVGTGSGVQGATVSLTGNTGTVLASTTTDSQGGFKFTTIPAGATLFKVSPDAALYFADFLAFTGNTYYYPYQNQANTGPCFPALPNLVAGDNQLANAGIFSTTSPAPPPFGCPR